MKMLHIQKQLIAYFNIIKTYYYLLPKNNRRALAVIVPIFIVLLLIPTSDSLDENENEDTNQKVQIEIAKEEASKPRPSVTTKWQRYQIKKGDSLIKIFRINHIPDTDLYAIAAIEGKDKPVSRVHPGQWIQFKQLKDSSLDALLIEMDNDDPIMYFRLSSGKFIRDK